MDTSTGSVGAGQADGVPIHLKDGANAPSNGDDHSFMEEVGRKPRQLQLNRHEGGVLIRGELQGPLEELEQSPLNVEGLLQQHLQEIYPVMKLEQHVTALQGTDLEILLEAETLSKVGRDVLKGRTTLRSPGDDGELQRQAGKLDLV